MKKLLILTILIFLWGCDSKFNATFYISNGSQDRTEVPLRVIVDGDTIFDKNTNYTNIAPDLQYIEHKKITKGLHEIIFEVGNSKLRRVENIQFNNDKWFFLSYYFKKPADSIKKIQLDKTFNGVKDSTTLFLYNGRKPGLTFHIMETEPIHH